MTGSGGRLPVATPARGRLARGAALVVGLVGLAVLAGWWLELPALRSGIGNGAAINPATAVLFLLAAVSIWISSLEHAASSLRRLGTACGAMVFLIAGLKLAAPLIGLPPDFDQILFRAKLAALGTKAPEPMTAGSAIIYLMIGTALLLARASRQALRLLSRSIGLFLSLIGILMLVTLVYRWLAGTGASGSSSAIGIAIGFTALSAALVIAGPSKLGPGDQETDTLALRGKVRVAVVVAVAILVLMGALSIWSTVRSRNADRLQEASSARRAQILTLLSSLQDAETGQRGFLLTGEPEFLEPYRLGVDSLPGVLRRTEALLGAWEPQARRLDALEPLVHQRFVLLAEAIRLHESHRTAESLAMMRAGRGKAVMDEIRRRIASIVAGEDSLYAGLEARVLRDDRIALTTSVIAALLAVCFLILAGLAINQDLRKRGEMEAALRQTELIVSSVGEGIHGIDLSGRIIFENPAAARMLGWSEADLIGKPAHATIHHHQTDGTEYPQGNCPICATLRDGQPRQAKDEVFWRQDGTSFPVDYSTAPLRDRAGRLYGGTVIFRDTTDRKRLEEERDRFFTLSLDMLCIAKSDGYFKRLNPAFTQTLGWSMEELLARPFLDFVHPDDQAATLREVERQTIAGEEVLHFENRYRHKDGSWRVLSWKSVPHRDGLMFATARDVTEQRRTEAMIRQSAEAAEAANRSKSDFLAKMSHELRTPLNSIIGFSEILEDGTAGSLTDKQRRYVTNVLTSGRNLLQLINDILDLSKVEAGRMELNPSELDLDTAFEEVRGLVSALGDKKRLTIEVAPQPAGLRLRADSVRFRQIMFNLVGNAIKFTPDGGRVDITSRLLPSAQDDASRGWLEVAVTDTGIGVAPENLELIFNEFEQVDSGRGQTQAGTGLGLALTRKLVQLHGGRVWAESEVGRGSTFRFTLPAEIEQPLPVSRADAPAPAAPTGPLILVVDDEAHARDLMAHYLTDAGYRVVSTGLGEEAVALARDLRPDAITLDILLPGQNGVQTLAALKSHPDTRAIPVVVVSVTDQHDLGRSLGVTDWLVKPVQRSSLVAVLARTIGTAPRAVPRTVLVVDDEPAAVEYLGELLAQQGFGVISASGGRLGIELALARRPDLIILDLMMPEVNGFDVVRTLRSHPDAGDIPILVLTAKELDQQERLQLRESVQAIVAKGGRSQLLDELQRICSPALAEL